jgi:hypothetical protein
MLGTFDLMGAIAYLTEEQAWMQILGEIREFAGVNPGREVGRLNGRQLNNRR